MITSLSVLSTLLPDRRYRVRGRNLMQARAEAVSMMCCATAMLKIRLDSSGTASDATSRLIPHARSQEGDFGLNQWRLNELAMQKNGAYRCPKHLRMSSESQMDSRTNAVKIQPTRHSLAGREKSCFACEIRRDSLCAKLSEHVLKKASHTALGACHKHSCSGTK